VVIDMDLRLPQTCHLFDTTVKTIVFNTVKQEERDNLLFYQLIKEGNLVHQINAALYQLNMQSVLIEGGAKLLQSFIDEDIYEEVRVITNNGLQVPVGIAAPSFSGLSLTESFRLHTDRVHIYKREFVSP
jgi:diaminohydroxyphosphoribosylaminopyrimidine deaminase/5-amino-6-(5-phosphoribosylamino)uracil reductase